MRLPPVVIKHPEHLKQSNMERILSLYNAGLLPKSIAGCMLVVSLKHPLRAIYGSDLRAALALLWQATFGVLEDELRYWTWKIFHPGQAAEIRRDAADMRQR